MLSRDVGRPSPIREAPYDLRRALVEYGSIGDLIRKCPVNAAADYFGERNPLLSRPGPKLPHLLLCQLNLRSYHDSSVITT